jgi:Spy/CpxP family protein refolding chaperone
VSPARTVLLTLALSLATAGLGAWGGATYAMRHAHAVHPPLHSLVHEELKLSPDQARQIDELEAAYAERRRSLEARMRQANAELAAALSDEHAYTPRVQLAVDHFHAAMGELQKETIMHVLAMRAVLTPAQTATFDKTVAKALVQTPS